MAYEPKDLIGTWRLATWEIRYGDSKDKSYPFGDDAQGLLIYAADGHMSATISRTERQPLSTESLRQAPMEEKAGAFEGYFHYSGKWVIDGDYVVHDVLLSLNPAFVGTVQRRLIKLEDDYLRLSAEDPAKLGSNSRFHYLVWQRH